jgi:hypothetical protein
MGSIMKLGVGQGQFPEDRGSKKFVVFLKTKTVEHRLHSETGS